MSDLRNKNPEAGSSEITEKLHSRFFSDKYRDLKAYTPGEQPRVQQLIKLNTNENPYPPAPGVEAALKGLARIFSANIRIRRPQTWSRRSPGSWG